MDPDQTAPIGAVCSGSTLFASTLNSSVMLGNYLQQTTSADDIFRCIFFLGALRIKKVHLYQLCFTEHIFRKKHIRCAVDLQYLMVLFWFLLFIGCLGILPLLFYFA